MTNNWIILFVVIPLGTGVLSLALSGMQLLQRIIGTMSLTATFILAVGLLVQISTGTGDQSILVSQMGAWPAPFGITVVFDSLSGLLLATSAIVALSCFVHSFSILRNDLRRRYFHPLFHLLMFGVNLSFMTGDLFNLFVSFEIMLMASYALLCLGGGRKQLSQAYKYVLLNILASTVFVICAGLVYGMMGTLNFADLAVKVREMGPDNLPRGFKALSVMILLVFGAKGAFFPLWFWLPDTYYTCPISISALFGGLLTKVGVYAVARTFPMIFAFGDNSEIVGPILAVAAAFTMFVGVLGAVSQREIRRILAIHVISQVGYMIFGIAVAVGVMTRKPEIAVLAMAGCLFHIVHNMVAKSALFLCCGVMEKHAGSDNLDQIGGLLKKHVWLGVLFFIAAMSLVGLPPLSGFFGKLTLIKAGWHDYWWLSMVALVTGVLTLLSMLKIWSYGFWSPAQSVEGVPEHTNPEPGPLRGAYAGIIILVIAALFLGLAAEPIYKIANRAGTQSQNPQAYIDAVLSPGVHQKTQNLVAQPQAGDNRETAAPSELSSQGISAYITQPVVEVTR